MCGRFTSTTPVVALAEAFAVDDVRTEAMQPRWNVAPTQPILTVATRRSRAAEGEEGGPRRALGAMRWGLVPSWARDISVGNKMINARAETLADKPAYRSALLRRRCLIPADAFYEWQVQVAAEGAGAKGRLPWAVRRCDGAPMALAGLWEVWRDPAAPADAPPLRSAVIVTTSANEVLAPIHHRMPVVVDPADWDLWLDPTVGDQDFLQTLLVPAPADALEAFPVSSRVNKVDHDGPELLDALSAPAG